MPSLAMRVQSRSQQSAMPARVPWIRTRSSRQNSLLDAFPDDVFERICPHLERVDLQLGSWLIDQFGNTEKYASQYVYFPIDAIVALLCVTASGASTQTAMVGYEGMVGISSCIGGDGVPSCAVVQSAGQAFKLPVRLFIDEFEGTLEVTQILLRYTQSLITQIGQTAACNRHHLLEQQLCRWILSSSDRVQGNDLYVTQELISNMLGVRREGVTEAAGHLQRRGMINLSRGCISILDRAALENHTCECYAVIKRDTERFLDLATDRATISLERGWGKNTDHPAKGARSDSVERRRLVSIVRG